MNIKHPYLWFLSAGLIAAAWVVLGRALFGIMGSFTGLYVFLLGVPILGLHYLIARNIALTTRSNYTTRPRTIIAVSSAWICFFFLGLMIPDKVEGVWHTVLTGETSGRIGMAIGISNPLGIIGIGLCVATIICAYFDARGPRITEDDILDAAE